MWLFFRDSRATVRRPLYQRSTKTRRDFEDAPRYREIGPESTSWGSLVRAQYRPLTKSALSALFVFRDANADPAVCTKCAQRAGNLVRPDNAPAAVVALRGCCRRASRSESAPFVGAAHGGPRLIAGETGHAHATVRVGAGGVHAWLGAAAVRELRLLARSVEAAPNRVT